MNKPGDLCVGLDPQCRLGDRTWLVFIESDGTLERDTVQLGLFWDREVAEFFMGSIARSAALEGICRWINA